MEIEIVKWFQSFGNDILDTLNILITRFGEDIFFISIFLFIFWCAGHEKAFKFALFYLVTVGLNTILKNLVMRPRPWKASADVINKLSASGYSFPSGHSVSVSAICSQLTYDVFNDNHKKSFKISFLIGAIILCLLVAMSRLYLGQHYLTDVLTGLAFGSLVMWLFNFLHDKFFKNIFKKIKPEYVFATFGIIMLAIMLIVNFGNFGLSDGKIFKVFKYAGLGIGSAVGYIVYSKIHIEINANFWEKIIKLAIGYFIIFGSYALLLLMPSTSTIIFIIMLFESFIATCVYPYLYNLIFLKIKKAKA